MDWRLFFLDAARWIDFVEGTFLSIYSREIYFRVFSQEDGSRICYVIIIFEKDFYSSSFWIMLIMFWTIFLKRWIDGCSRLECVDKMDG